MLCDEKCRMMSVLQKMVTDAVMHDDVHVAEDGHRCCVLTIMQYCSMMSMLQRMVTYAV